MMEKGPQIPASSSSSRAFINQQGASPKEQSSLAYNQAATNRGLNANKSSHQHGGRNSFMGSGGGSSSLPDLMGGSRPGGMEDDVQRCPFLYSQTSFSRLYSEKLDDDPGPGHYELPGAFGRQWQSMQETAPSVSIPDKHASSWAKVFISKEASNASGKAKDTPGPGTYTPMNEAIDPLTGVRFAGSTRPKPSYDTPSPGPVYDIRGGLFGVPTAGFSKCDRFSGGLKDESLGPGMYHNIPGALDVNRQAKSFAASRQAYDKVAFPGKEREWRGRASPGPGSFRPFECTLARKAVFSKDLRKGLSWDSGAPGPGSYDVRGKVTQAVKSKSAYTFGKPPEQARLSWKRQLYETSTWARLNMAKQIRTPPV